MRTSTLVSRIATTGGVLLLAAGAWADDHELPAPSGNPDIISPDARIEVVFDEAFFTEGPAVALDGSVYFSDITFTGVSGMQAGHIWRYDPGTGTTAVYRSPSGMSNGLKFDAMGRLIACEGADFGGRRVTRTDLTTGKAEIIAGTYKGKKFNAPNDVSLDEMGRIYFSDPRYLGHESMEMGVFAVYRIDTDGSIHRIITDAGKPNGVAVSPDQKSLYVVSNDNGATGLPLAAAAPGSLTGDDPSYKGRMALLAYDLGRRRERRLPRGAGRLLARRRPPTGWCATSGGTSGWRCGTRRGRESSAIPRRARSSPTSRRRFRPTSPSAAARRRRRST